MPQKFPAGKICNNRSVFLFIHQTFSKLEQLRGIATNINQIARVANQTRVIDVDPLKEFEKEVKDIISDLRKKYL